MTPQALRPGDACESQRLGLNRPPVRREPSPAVLEGPPLAGQPPYPHEFRPPVTKERLTGKAVRANPFPKVTGLICRLPLHTFFFYETKTAHPGDLMRIAVRMDETQPQLLPAAGFSRRRTKPYRALIEDGRRARSDLDSD